MKHTTSIIKLFSLALLLISGYACTGNFDKINQKDYQVDKEELGREGYNVGASLKGLQGLVIPTEEHLYQFVEALAAGSFAGYIGCTVEWTAKFETYNPPTDWLEAPFSDLITRTYPFYRDLLDETEDPVALALGKLLRVSIMHRVTICTVLFLIPKSFPKLVKFLSPSPTTHRRKYINKCSKNWTKYAMCSMIISL